MKAPLFNFKQDVSKVIIPLELNNPFSKDVSEISILAAKEFQDFISIETQTWEYDFFSKKGKMFGVLVVQKKDKTLGYLGAISGKIPANGSCEKFIPSILDDSEPDFFLNVGMSELTAMSQKIKKTEIQSEIDELSRQRKQKSIDLQQKLFEHYRFINVKGVEKNMIEIFEKSTHGNPPAAAGECAAPKLFHYAFIHGLKPIALAEFWWGIGSGKKAKIHKEFYPACKNKCRPILEFMLDDKTLYNSVQNKIDD